MFTAREGQRSLSSLTVDRLIDSFRELQVGTSSSETDHDHVTIIIFSPPTDPLQKVIWPEQHKLDWYTTQYQIQAR